MAPHGFPRHDRLETHHRRPSHRRVQPHDLQHTTGRVTYSIVAFDPATGDLAIGVASRFLAVGAVVPYARAGVGAVATQAFANTRWGPRGLELLAAGSEPDAAIAQLQAEDVAPPDVSRRQVGIVDARGRAASFSGADCTEWAGGRTGQHYACQGNILSGPEVVAALGSG